MAPRTEFNPEQVRTKARKDLLYLLEGVRKAPSSSFPSGASLILMLPSFRSAARRMWSLIVVL